MLQNTAQLVFNKCVRLLEQRLKIKVKTAVLSIDTDFGTFQYTLNDNLVENLLLLEKMFHQDLIRLATKGQVSGGIIVCPDCLGSGEGIREGALITCGRCNGGGEVIPMLDKTGDKSEQSTDSERIQHGRINSEPDGINSGSAEKEP